MCGKKTQKSGELNTLRSRGLKTSNEDVSVKERQRTTHSLGFFIFVMLLLGSYLITPKNAGVEAVRQSTAGNEKREQRPPVCAGSVSEEVPRERKPSAGVIAGKGMRSCYVNLTASWYSVASLKKEGTYKYSKGVMANGKKFKEEAFTSATRIFPLNSTLKVTNIDSGVDVRVKVTDRIGKRFATKRIDLSKAAFAQIAELDKGLVKVKVEVID